MKMVCDMSQEKEYCNDVFPEGRQLVKILDVSVEKSSRGNDVVIIKLEHAKLGLVNKFWLPLATGKRWLLKSLLEATGLYKKDDSGNYEIDTDKLLGVCVTALFANEENPYTNSEGRLEMRKRSRIKRFIPSDVQTGTTKKENAGWKLEDLSAPKKEEDDVEIPF